jgi:hypothetical protein
MSLPTLTGTISQGGCSSAAPTGMYMKSIAAASANHITVLAVTPSGEIQLDIANGETIGIGTLQIIDPTLRILAKAFHAGGDAATSWAWDAGVAGAAVVSAPDPLPTEEDITGNQIHVLIMDAATNPVIQVSVTGSNCGGSDISDVLAFTVTAG